MQTNSMGGAEATALPPAAIGSAPRRGTRIPQEIQKAVIALFNHQTDHRGQSRPMPTQRGVDVGVTDLLEILTDTENRFIFNAPSKYKACYLHARRRLPTWSGPSHQARAEPTPCLRLRRVILMQSMCSYRECESVAIPDTFLLKRFRRIDRTDFFGICLFSQRIRFFQNTRFFRNERAQRPAK